MIRSTLMRGGTRSSEVIPATASALGDPSSRKAKPIRSSTRGKSTQLIAVPAPPSVEEVSSLQRGFVACGTWFSAESQDKGSSRGPEARRCSRPARARRTTCLTRSTDCSMKTSSRLLLSDRCASKRVNFEALYRAGSVYAPIGARSAEHMAPSACRFLFRTPCESSAPARREDLLSSRCKRAT